MEPNDHRHSSENDASNDPIPFGMESQPDPPQQELAPPPKPLNPSTEPKAPDAQAPALPDGPQGEESADAQPEGTHAMIAGVVAGRYYGGEDLVERCSVLQTEKGKAGFFHAVTGDPRDQSDEDYRNGYSLAVLLIGDNALIPFADGWNAAKDGSEEAQANLQDCLDAHRKPRYGTAEVLLAGHPLNVQAGNLSHDVFLLGAVCQIASGSRWDLPARHEGGGPPTRRGHGPIRRINGVSTLPASNVVSLSDRDMEQLIVSQLHKLYELAYARKLPMAQPVADAAEQADDQSIWL